MKDRGIASARRTEQYSGNNEDGLSDVIAPKELPSWHIESKGTKSAKITQGQANKWLLQVDADCRANQIPVILNTANGEDLIAVLPYKTLLKVQSVIGTQFQYVPYVDTSIIPSKLFNTLKEEELLYNYVKGGYSNFLPFNAYIFKTSNEPYTACVIIYAETWLEVAKNYEARIKASTVTSDLLSGINPNTYDIKTS